MIVLRVSARFFVTLRGIMIYYRTAKQRYEIVIGEKGLAILKTGCLGINQGEARVCNCNLLPLPTEGEDSKELRG